MRTHEQIVREAGAAHLATLRSVSVETARSWAKRNSIPSDHWLGLSNAGVATLVELAQAAAPAEERAA